MAGEEAADRRRPAWLLPLAIVAVALLATIFAARHDWPLVAQALAQAGWALVIVIALHVPQTLASALAWRTLVPAPIPTPARSYRLRWIRDSINTLLPVAQVGGDVARIRLAARGRGQRWPAAAAAVIVDVSWEVVAQVVFTVAAVLVLLAQTGFAGGEAVAVAGAAMLTCIVIGAGFWTLWRWGVIQRLEGVATRRLWIGAERLAGTAAAMTALHDRPRRVAACLVWHLVAWGLGAVETYAALRAIGIHQSFAAAVVIEALGHAARAVGFFVPGSLGVQEGGYVLVCGLYGIASPAALAVSVIKRIREVVLGVPGLLLWGWTERGEGDPLPADDKEFI